MSEIWQTCLVFITEEEGRIEATYLEEPMVIFKLLKVTVNFHLLMCDPVECSENNFSDDIAEINQLIYVNAFEHISENSYDKVTSMNCVHTKTCPAITEKKERMSINLEIRPLVRLFRKTSASPPPQASLGKEAIHQSPKQNAIGKEENQLETKTKVKQTTDQRDISQFRTRTNVKFSSSPSIYTQEKPSYKSYSKYERPRYTPVLPRSFMFSSYNLTARARSEFRERSIPVGRRSYVSLYS